MKIKLNGNTLSIDDLNTISIDPPQTPEPPPITADARFQELELKIQGVVPPLRAITDLACTCGKMQEQVNKLDAIMTRVRTQIEAMEQKQTMFGKNKNKELDDKLDEIVQGASRHKTEVNAILQELRGRVSAVENLKKVCDQRSDDVARQLNALSTRIMAFEKKIDDQPKNIAALAYRISQLQGKLSQLQGQLKTKPVPKTRKPTTNK